ncbi:MAG: hypothetical protein ACOH2A_00545 [Sphingobacteriaceae bacterium]
MSAIDFAQIFNQLKDEAIGQAKTAFKDRTREAENDASELLERMKEKLSRWTVLVADGSLTIDDFKFLVNSQKDLITMHALAQAGETAIAVDNLKNGIIDTIVETGTRLIPV